MDDNEQSPDLWSLLNLLEEQRMRDLELSGVGGYAGSNIRNMMPDRPMPLERFAQQPEADPGVIVRPGINVLRSGSNNVYGGGGALELAFPLLEGMAGARVQGSASYVEPDRGRSRTQIVPQGVQGYYETPEGSRYSLEYTQTPRESNPSEYARELMLRYSRRF